MITAIVAFFLGVFLAPVVRPVLRPVLVELVKAFLTIVEETKRVSAQVREDMEDVAAEAKAQATAKQQKTEPAPEKTAPTD